MDKSEQILELISKMTTEMKEGFKDTNNKFDELQTEMQDGYKDLNNKFDGLQFEMKEGFREAYNERQKIRMVIENNVNKNISLLVEGQKNINNKLDEMLKFQDEKELLTIRI